MNLLAIKCYLPGRRTQYVLYPTEDMSIELGPGADLCPRGFDAGIRVLFRLVGEQWYVEPLLGEVRHEDGSRIDGSSAVVLPAMLIAGSATLVLDASIDPRVPARVIQSTSDSARHAAEAPGPAPVAYAAPRAPRQAYSEPPASRPAHEAPRAPREAPRGGDSTAANRSLQPRAATLQPQVGTQRAPVLEPRVTPSVVVHQAEQPAVRELHETRILDMAQLGAPFPPEVAASDPVEQTGIRRVIAHIKRKPRMVAYAVLGVALVAFQVGTRMHQQALAIGADQAHSAAVARRMAAAAGPASALAKPAVRSPAEVEPLPPGVEPDANRAAALYAAGDFAHALSQYRALAAVAGADPVFDVIAHSLAQRLRHPQVK